MIKSFRQFIREGGGDQDPPVIESVFVPVSDQPDEAEYQRLDEGRWLDGRFEKNIRIDQPTHGVGQQHAHVYGRKGDEIGVINFDGSASHGSKMRLHKQDIAALTARGFVVPDDGIVEWLKITGSFLLLEG